MKQNNKKGFTIIELMFSTMIFSVILLLCLSALVQIGRMYYKGVTTSQTQQAARALLDDLSQTIQFSAGKITSPPNFGRRVNPGSTAADGAVGFFCIGDTRYSFAMDRKQGATNDATKKTIKHAFWVDHPGQCAGATGMEPADLLQDRPTADGQDMLSENMRLTRLSVDQPPLGSKDGSTWMVKLTVAYGDDDLLVDDPDDSTRRYCQGAQIGTQFCAFSELSTIVKRRIL